MDYVKYLNAFVDEANEIVHALNRYLLDLEQTSGNPAILKGLFRSVHTLKASSQTMGFNRMAKLSHEMEDIISDIQKERIELDGGIFDRLFRIVDSLESFLFHICEFGSEGKSGSDDILKETEINEGVYDGLTVAAGKTAPAAAATATVTVTDPPLQYNAYEQAAIKNAFEDGRMAYEIHVVLMRDCLMKAARAFIIIQALERQGDIIRSRPNIEAIEDERFGYEFTITILSKSGAESFQSILNGLSEIERFDIVEVQPDMVNLHTGGARPGTAGGEAARAAENAERQMRDGLKNTLYGRSARIDLYQLDSLQNRISEHSGIVADIVERLPKSFAKHSAGLIAQLEHSVAGLENAAANLGTTSLMDIFDSFPKIFDELTDKLGKHAKLTINGGDIRCDINLVSGLRQPLLHLLRNSVDHGIEPSEIRIAKGKDANGLVSVNAFTEGGDIVVEVEDDGAGVNLAKVREKAIKAGIISEIEALEISKDSILKLIFQPTLSTREYISMYSGRGVGMDVVKARTEELGGTVEIDSEEGRGTKISLRMPRAEANIIH